MAEVIVGKLYNSVVDGRVINIVCPVKVMSFSINYIVLDEPEREWACGKEFANRYWVELDDNSKSWQDL
jgi:hypothetical protein